jgi:hypothetical protein
MYMTQLKYMHLDANLKMKVLDELGLVVTVKKAGKYVRFGSPNWTVPRNATDPLMKLTNQEVTPESLAREYLVMWALTASYLKQQSKSTTIYAGGLLKGFCWIFHCGGVKVKYF